jgi:hypothetical protein
MQQTPGGEAIAVFRGSLQSGQELSARSVRKDGAPLGLTVRRPIN